MKSFTHLTYELSLIETLDAFQMGIGAYLKVSLEVRLGWFLVLLLFLKNILKIATKNNCLGIIQGPKTSPTHVW